MMRYALHNRSKAVHALCAAGLWLSLTTGCGGHARMELLSLQHNAIDPPAPRSVTYQSSRCFWWQNENKEMVVTMRFERGDVPFFLPQPVLDLSIVLPKPPAGTAANYLVSRREVRGVFTAGLEEHRFHSLQGICKLVREPNGRLSGSYRFWMLHQPGAGIIDLFPRRPSTMLFQGTFEAEAERDGIGAAILTSTEDHGWHRDDTEDGNESAPAEQASKWPEYEIEPIEPPTTQPSSE